MIRLIATHNQSEITSHVEKLKGILDEKNIEYIIDNNYDKALYDRIFVPNFVSQFVIGDHEVKNNSVCVRRYNEVIHSMLMMNNLPHFLEGI